MSIGNSWKSPELSCNLLSFSEIPGFILYIVQLIFYIIGSGLLLKIILALMISTI